MALHCFLGTAQQRLLRLLCLPQLCSPRRILEVAHKGAGRKDQHFQLDGGESPGLGVCHHKGAVHRAGSRPIS